MEHLAALTERGLDDAPELLLLVGPEAIVRIERLDHDHRRLDRRLGLERLRRHAERDTHPGVVLREHRQVAHLPGRRGNPFGDLALDHEHEPRGTGRLAEQRVEDRACDVVRQVGNDVVGRLEEPDEVLVERVTLDQAQPTGRIRSSAVGPLELGLEAVAQERGEATIKLDRRDRCPAVEEAAREHPEPGADLEDAPAGAGSASARIASRTSASARKFCESA